ncbi:partner of Y14-MAGO [Striga hermonthica]|uniref:Partner of Y14-MAGO n=1 Tax=Striga hermonthica TaxID=68872 RepID=A0A9N7MXL5_STRHE|nr:partner of Y14-MAGO [Striga hermonthica]
MGSNADGEAEDATQLTAELGRTLKDGERILGPTRRPDGSLRKPIRIRAGYTPQDEVAIYQSRGAIWKKEMAAIQEVPPGYEPVEETKPKSKAAKRNERKKGKRQQAALDMGKSSEQNDTSPADSSADLPENVDSVASKMNGLSLSGSASVVAPSDTVNECATPSEKVQDIDKKIRALKKKIRLTEAQQHKASEKDLKPEQLEKVAKLDGWRNELKLLEDKKAELTTSFS